MTSNSPACIHRVLEGNIQEFVLTETSRRAVDELFDTVENIMKDAYARNDMSIIAGRFLLDCRVGILPLNHAFARALSMTKNYPSHPQSRTACLFASGPLVKPIYYFLRRVVSVHIYGIDERDAALAWLSEPVEAKSGR